MVDTVQAIADLEERPEIKARYFYTMAQLYRDKLEDPDRAVELFNEALDLNPSYLEAFERINKILTDQKDWKQLERAYRKMIHRIAGKGNVDLESTLWHQLGLIYRDRLELTQEAIESFKMASVTKPDVVLEHQILAELYEATEQLDEAIREQRIILDADPTDVEPYRASTGCSCTSRPTTRRGAWPRRWPSCARPTRRRQVLRGLSARRASCRCADRSPTSTGSSTCSTRTRTSWSPRSWR